MIKDPNPSPQPPSKPASGGCVPMITLLVGLGMLAIGVLAVLNTAFGWKLNLEVYGSSTPVPSEWDSTIAVLVVGGLFSLVGWLMGTPRFTRFYRKNKLLVILGSISIVVGVFFLLNEYDKSIRRGNAEKFALMDSLLEANPEAYPSEDEPAYNPYADRKIRFLVTNPTLDTMQVYINGKQTLEIEPYEFEDGELDAGQYRLAAAVKGDTIEAMDLVLPERQENNLYEIFVVNVDSFFNIGFLNFQDFYDSNNKKRKGAKTVNYRLELLQWHEHIFSINPTKRPTVVLPRHISFDFSSGNALKIVILPDEYENDKDNAFDYAIWKFIDEEKKGYMQDGMDFYMLSPEKRKQAIKNRLSDDLKRFKKADL